MHRSRVCHFVIDVPDLDQGTAFWAAALGATEETLPETSRPIYRSLRLPDSEIRVLLQKTSDAKTGKERMHLDLETDDIEAEVTRLEALGATRHDHQAERGWDFWVLHDPWGNEFCVLPPLFPGLLAQREPWDGTAEPGPEKPLRVHNDKVIQADRQPGILARELGSMLQKAREVVGLSYAQAAARLGRETDWLVRVETGFATASPEEVARILVEYGVREARIADTIIDMARRAAAPPPWLASHTSRLTAASRDLLLIEAEATLAQVHGFLLIPPLVQAEGYFRELAPKIFPECDVDQEWDLLSHRQAHRPAGVTRLLEAIIDESALERVRHPEAMAGQLRHLLALADSPHATVRIIPRDAAFWEGRGHNFDVLSFAGTTDRIGVSYSVLGAQLASGSLYDLWARIESNSAADPARSRAILERHLAALG